MHHEPQRAIYKKAKRNWEAEDAYSREVLKMV